MGRSDAEKQHRYYQRGITKMLKIGQSNCGKVAVPPERAMDYERMGAIDVYSRLDFEIKVGLTRRVSGLSFEPE